MQVLTLHLGPFPPDVGISTRGPCICYCGQFIKAPWGLMRGSGADALHQPVSYGVSSAFFSLKM